MAVSARRREGSKGRFQRLLEAAFFCAGMPARTESSDRGGKCSERNDGKGTILFVALCILFAFPFRGFERPENSPVDCFQREWAGRPPERWLSEAVTDEVPRHHRFTDKGLKNGEPGNGFFVAQRVLFAFPFRGRWLSEARSDEVARCQQSPRKVERRRGTAFFAAYLANRNFGAYSHIGRVIGARQQMGPGPRPGAQPHSNGLRRYAGADGEQR